MNKTCTLESSFLSDFNKYRQGQDRGQGSVDQGYGYEARAITLTRNLIGRVVMIGTTPTEILPAIKKQRESFIVLNPSRGIGISELNPVFNGDLMAFPHSTTPNPIDVSGFQEAHIHLNVGSIVGNPVCDIWGMSYDSVSASWIDTQKLFENISVAPLLSYAYLGEFGVAQSLAFRFETVSGVGNINAQISVVLKGGAGEGLADHINNIYLGGPDVTIVAGFPLMAGYSEIFTLMQGVELYGVASSPLPLRIFQI